MSEKMCPLCGWIYETHLMGYQSASLVPDHEGITTLPANMSSAALDSGAVEEVYLCPGSMQEPVSPKE